MGQYSVAAGWSADVRDDGVIGVSTGFDRWFVDGLNTWRSVMRFAPSAIPSGFIPTQIVLRIYLFSLFGTYAANVRTYGADGSTDPEADSGATLFASAISSAVLTTKASFAALGYQDIDITCAKLKADLVAVSGTGTLSLALALVSEAGAGNGALFDEFSGTHPPLLIVTYEPGVRVAADWSRTAQWNATTDTYSLIGAGLSLKAGNSDPTPGPDVRWRWVARFPVDAVLPGFTDILSVSLHLDIFSLIEASVPVVLLFSEYDNGSMDDPALDSAQDVYNGAIPTAPYISGGAFAVEGVFEYLFDANQGVISDALIAGSPVSVACITSGEDASNENYAEARGSDETLPAYVPVLELRVSELRADPAAAHLSLTGGRPSVAKRVRPGADSLALSGGTPTLRLENALHPGGAQLSFAGGTPELTNTTRFTRWRRRGGPPTDWTEN